MHQRKTPKGAWAYLAVPAGSSLTALKEDERLYIGSQTVDRMFRGDFTGEMRGKNFHHREMRRGSHGDNAEAFLKSGGRFDIFMLDAQSLVQKVASDPALRSLVELMGQRGKHHGYWLEQFILATQPGRWRWNEKGADFNVQSFLRQRGTVS